MSLAFIDISHNEHESLLRIPALISLYAASGDHEVSRKEKGDAVKFAHLKIFTASPTLTSFYRELDQRFEEIFDQEYQRYFPFDEPKRELLHQRIVELLALTDTLEKNVAQRLLKSFSDYEKNIKKACRGNWVNFVLPLPMPGLTD